MTEQKQSAGGLSGWLKAGLTSVFGVFSGAVLMYLTPLVNNVIKPPRPVANFALQVQGLTVTFNNRSLGGTQGWWDFGDGSALEPFSPKQDTVPHTYPRPGNYNVKLMLQNLLGEENTRDITVNIDPASAPKPAITQFQVTPEKTNKTNAAGKLVAPAVFRIEAKVENAQMCVWGLGGSRALEVSTDTAAPQERLVTLKWPGKHALRLVAVNGKQTVEETREVEVESRTQLRGRSPGQAEGDLRGDGDQPGDAPPQRPRRVDGRAARGRLPVRGDAAPGQRPQGVPDRLGRGDQQAGSARAQPESRDRPGQDALRRSRRTGAAGALVELNQQAPPPWVVEVALNVEKRSKAQAVPMEEIPVNINVPGTTAIPIPRLSSGWQMTNKQLHLELCDGSQVVWSGDRPLNNIVLKLCHRQVLVSAAEQGDRLVLQINDAAAARPVSRGGP